jgi:hypothetical protein
VNSRLMSDWLRGARILLPRTSPNENKASNVAITGRTLVCGGRLSVDKIYVRTFQILY